MVDLQQEREHLIRADRHLAAGKRRIAEQIILIKTLTQQGQDRTEAKKPDTIGQGICQLLPGPHRRWRHHHHGLSGQGRHGR